MNKLVELIFPDESGEIFVSERDDTGKLLAITEVWEYLKQKNQKRSRASD